MQSTASKLKTTKTTSENQDGAINPLCFNVVHARRLLAQHIENLQRIIELQPGSAARYTNVAKALDTAPQTEPDDEGVLTVEDIFRFLAGATRPAEQNAVRCVGENHLTPLNQELLRMLDMSSQETYARIYFLTEPGKLSAAKTRLHIELGHQLKDYIPEISKRFLVNRFSAVRQAVMLTDTFRSMATYRVVALALKYIEVGREIDSLSVIDPSSSEANDTQGLKTKLESNGSSVHRWKEEALHMLQAADGLLPGQFCAQQPLFLPLQISAPPRVGKSAIALQFASIAKLLGMTVMYSVSPNKNLPINEMTTKLGSIGWESWEDEKHTPLGNQATRQMASSADVNQDRHTKFRYKHERIENVWNDLSSIDNLADMVLYSSDVLSDIQQAGILCAELRLSEKVVFHMRDEAQSLSKRLLAYKGGSSRFAPIPLELQLLRTYYGNVYGMNCLISATQWPVFTEEGLWGFVGSTTQNVKIGLPADATQSQIKSSLGEVMLPRLVPVTSPFIPNTYAGVFVSPNDVALGSTASEDKLYLKPFELFENRTPLPSPTRSGGGGSSNLHSRQRRRRR